MFAAKLAAKLQPVKPRRGAQIQADGKDGGASEPQRAAYHPMVMGPFSKLRQNPEFTVEKIVSRELV